MEGSEGKGNVVYSSQHICPYIPPHLTPYAQAQLCWTSQDFHWFNCPSLLGSELEFMKVKRKIKFKKADNSCTVGWKSPSQSISLFCLKRLFLPHYHLKILSQIQNKPRTLTSENSVKEVLPGTGPGSIWSSNIAFGVSAPLTDIHFWDIGLPDFGTGQVDPGTTFITLYHWPTSKWLHAVTRHQIPGVIILCFLFILSGFLRLKAGSRKPVDLWCFRNE